MVCNRVALGVLAIVACLAVRPAAAQTDNPPPAPSQDIIAATTPLSEAQQNVVGDYVKYWCNALANGAEEKVFAARQKLTDPVLNPALVSPSKGGVFIKAYAAAVADNVAGLYKGPVRPISRMNFMILVKELADKGAGAEILPLVQKAMGDQDTGGAAARYWGTKAAESMGRGRSLTDKEEANLLADLVKAANAEKEPAALQQELIAMVCLNIPAGPLAMLDVADDRMTELHAKNPTMTLTPEREAMRELYKTRVAALATNNNVASDPVQGPLVRHLTATSYRYMDLAAQVLDRFRPKDPDARQEFRLMIELGDQILPWALEKLGGEIYRGKGPPSVKDDLDANMPQVRFIIGKWQDMFSEKPPFDLVKLEPVKINMQKAPEGGVSATRPAGPGIP